MPASKPNEFKKLRKEFFDNISTYTPYEQRRSTSHKKRLQDSQGPILVQSRPEYEMFTDRRKTLKLVKNSNISKNFPVINKAEDKI